jgi:transketolase
MQSMRDQMAQTIEDVMGHDERLVLAEISRTQLDQAFRKYPGRTFNVGIMEQTMIGVAAGMALEGFIPVVHSIAPFLVERPYEQLKDDFCYQRLGGNFISIGGSYDYSAEGMTHHGPGDVPILRNLPGMQIVVPGTPAELDSLFHEAYDSGSPTYYRLSLKRNSVDRPVRFGLLDVVRRGRRATVIAVGPMLAATLEAVEDFDVTVLYCTTVAPFDGATLREVSAGSDIALVEPYYAGALVPDVVAAMGRTPVRVEAIGVPHEVLSRYGTPEEHDAALGLTPEGLRRRIASFLNDSRIPELESDSP